MKWALLAKIADEKGIYWISTGHYVRKVLSGGKYPPRPVSSETAKAASGGRKGETIGLHNDNESPYVFRIFIGNSY